MADARETFSLTKALRDTGFSASVTTTYNAYLPFYEEVVLRRLVASGCTNNIVMMDARQCAEALAEESTRPRRAGVDYTLVPVRARGAFHPKILLRLGKRRGSLFIGSHNLTIAGFGMNDELTNRFEYDTKNRSEDVGAFVAAAELLRDFLGDSPKEVATSLEAALGAAPWLSKQRAVSDDIAVLGTRATFASLWDQLRARLPGPVSRVLVLAPFFDQGFEFLRQVREDLGGPEVVVALDPDTACADPASRGRLDGVRFVDARHHIPGTGRRDGVTPYLHAKALVFYSGEKALLATGSANASGAAFLASGRQRNTECIVARSLRSSSPLLDELRLNELFNAPAISNSAWSEMSARVKADGGESPESDGVSALLAVFDKGRCYVDGLDASALVAARVVSADGTDVGEASVVAVGPPAVFTATDEEFESASFLILDDGLRKHWAIIHRAAVIAEHHTSDTRRALRQAIGSLDEDPAQIEVLLKLSEKVIFDDDTPVASAEPEALRRAGQKRDAPGDAEEIDSLALDATGRRTSAKRRSIASGDITVILDALIHRLGSGESPSPGAGGPGVNEEEQVGADDDTDELPPALPDLGKLGATCRRKTRTLLKRMTKQLEATSASGDYRRAVVQVAAVLGILRALRTIELRDEWRRGGHRLIHEEALLDFFSAACPLLAKTERTVVPAVLADLDDDSCEELSMVLGLMTWLAWECGVDIRAARGQPGLSEAEADQWPWLQRLAYLAPYVATDARALEIAEISVLQTPRRGEDGDAWLMRQEAFLEEVATIVLSPDECQHVARPPRPGDIAFLAPQFCPRVRLVVHVQPGSRGTTLTVVDDDAKSGERKFLADRVPRLVSPARSATEVG